MTYMKYRSKPRWIDGIYFPSTKEARRYEELKMLEDAGVITDLQVHPKYVLRPKIQGFRRETYSPDFEYKINGIIKSEDIKGARKGVPYSLFQLKKRLFYEMTGRVVEEI